MSVNPQYTYDNNGNPVDVFLSINDWYKIAEELQIEIPEWQKKLIDLRLQEYYNNPTMRMQKITNQQLSYETFIGH